MEKIGSGGFPCLWTLKKCAKVQNFFSEIMISALSAQRLCQAKSPIKTLDKLDIIAVGEEIHFIVEARSFLHHQVRNMVGTLKMVGDGHLRA